MKDLCHDVFGIAKEKKDPKEVKTNRGIYPVFSFMYCLTSHVLFSFCFSIHVFALSVFFSDSCFFGQICLMSYQAKEKLRMAAICLMMGQRYQWLLSL